jgi:hypothetical protein
MKLTSLFKAPISTVLGETTDILIPCILLGTKRFLMLVSINNISFTDSGQYAKYDMLIISSFRILVTVI